MSLRHSRDFVNQKGIHMATATKGKSLLSPAQQILVKVQAAAAAGATWSGLHNSVFGLGGSGVKFFPSAEERTAFSKSPEYAEIMKLLDTAPDDEQLKRPEVNGKLLIRIPKSIHAALIVEAELEEINFRRPHLGMAEEAETPSYP